MIKMSQLSQIVLFLLTVIVLLFLIIPIVLILLFSLNSGNYISFPIEGFSLKWFGRVFFTPPWMDAIENSIGIALLTTAVSTGISIVTAYALVRGTFRWKKLLYLLILAPIIIPEIVTTIGLYFFFASTNFLNNIWCVVIGNTVLALPVATIILTSTLQGVNQNYEKAAASLGASPFTVFRKITLPLMMTGVISGALFSFLTSFDEMLMPLFMAGRDNITLPVQIWQTVLFGVEPTITAASSICIITTILVLILFSLLEKTSSLQKKISQPKEES